MTELERFLESSNANEKFKMWIEFLKNPKNRPEHLSHYEIMVNGYLEALGDFKIITNEQKYNIRMDITEL